MKKLFLAISVLFVAFMFIGTSFFMVIDHGDNSIISGNKSNTSVAPLIQNSSQNNSGYVKYTLDLVNNTLFNGNFVNTHNGVFPAGAAFDSSNGYVYVTNSGSNNVSVINGATNSVIATIDVGSYPYGAVFDSSNGYVYVTNYFSGTVSIISTSALIIKHYTVTFTESGLPSGTSWYVNITGQTSSGPITSSTYTASLINGTYSYTVSTSDKTYSPSPSSGSFTVNGGSVSKSVSFPLVKYTVTFTESGLPSGTSWSVTFNGTTESSTTNTITFTAANGTYSYSIGSVSGYTVSPSSGNITVNGKNISRDTIFTASSGISSTELYAIIGAVIAVAVIGSVVAITRKRR